jgi:hypothetical protein
MRRLAVLFVLVFAGCGQTPTSTDDFEGTEKAVAQTIEDLQTAAQNRKPAEICSDILSRALADRLKSEGNDCVEEMEKVSADADDFELEVKDVAVTGTTAKATVQARKGDDADAERTYSLSREDGDWRLTDLGSS